MTKFLALGPDELAPFPWELPLCSPYASEKGLSQKFEFITKVNNLNFKIEINS